MELKKLCAMHAMFENCTRVGLELEGQLKFCVATVATKTIWFGIETFFASNTCKSGLFLVVIRRTTQKACQNCIILFENIFMGVYTTWIVLSWNGDLIYFMYTFMK